MTGKKTLVRTRYIYLLTKDGSEQYWEIKETRTRRWYCYDMVECFAWSFMPDRAIKKLKKHAAANGFTIVNAIHDFYEVQI